METSPPSSNYANARALVAECLGSFLPPEQISTADFAAANRYLFNEGGGYTGRWTHEKAPYLVDIMDALDDAEHTTVAIVGPGQCGKTASVENWVFRTVVTDPANFLWYMQVEDTIESYVKRTINPMIENHKQLKSRLGLGRTDNSLKFKALGSAKIEFLAATHANVTNKHAGRIIADEYDDYRFEADPKTLLDVRRQTYGSQSKLACLSHADKAGGSKPQDWNAGILALYRESDRRTWWWPCPHCDMWSSPNPTATHHMSLEYDDTLPLDEIATTTHLLCPHNGCLIDDHERRAMNLRGKWVGSGQLLDPETGIVTGDLAARDIAGFWIVGIMSPFIFGGIGGLAAALVKARRAYEATGNDASLRQVVVKQMGHGYDPPRQASSLDAETLAERADPALRLGIAPHGARFITCAIDVQANRFEALFRAWGPGRESWVIEHRIRRNVEPATDPFVWDAFLKECAEAEFPLDDGSGRVMKVLGVGYDSAGEPGVTVQAMDAWRRAKKAGLARSVGRISGRPGYKLIPLKGGSTQTARTLQVVWPDARADRNSTARGDVPVGLFAPTQFKDGLAAQLGTGAPGPGYVHFPAGLRAERAPHPFFEQLVAERRGKGGRWEKISARNETWDLMVMTGVVAHLFAPSAFDWTRPPPWARDWAENPLVGVPTQPAGKAAPQSVSTGTAVQPAPVPAKEAVPPSVPPLPAQSPTSPRRSLAQIIAAQRAA